MFAQFQLTIFKLLWLKVNIKPIWLSMCYVLCVLLHFFIKAIFLRQNDPAYSILDSTNWSLMPLEQHILDNYARKQLS